MYTRDINRQIHQITRTEINQATTSLGMDIAPDGNMRSQFNKLLKSSRVWVHQVASSRLNRPDWMALTSTIWKTL
jgi:hypothetical protein